MSLTEKIWNIYLNITPFQAAMAISVIVLYVLYLILKDWNLPPGPTGLPLIGYWPFLKSYTGHIQLHELTKKYGNVFSFRVTGNLFIHLGSLKVIKEAHLTKSECFGGRFLDDSILTLVFNQGVAFINGEPWKVLRKYFVAKFKEYGMSAAKDNTAGALEDAVKESIDELREAKGRPVMISDMITKKCIKITRKVLFNDVGATEEELQKMCYLYEEMMKGMVGPNLLLIGNIAKYFVFPFIPSHWRMKRDNKRLEDLVFDLVERHKSEYNESQAVDIIDSYLKEREDRRKRGDPTAAYLTDRALVSSVVQFVTDGVISIGVFLGCFLMRLIEFPDEQDKIYNEILEVVGQDRLPTLEDKSKLPYTNAFIYEVTRLSDFFPLLPSLECTKETTLRGYKIPKGSITLVNMYGANRNPEDFENPDEFNPSRYIAKPGKPRAELPVLFGVGKRACIGEAFSMAQIFLFLTAIVQNFRLSLPENSKGSFMFWAEERAKISFHPRSHKSN